MQITLQGFTVSGYVQIFVCWAPLHERSRMMVNAHVGGFFGAIVNYPLSGFLANHFGWESVFYVTGKTTDLPLSQKVSLEIISLMIKEGVMILLFEFSILF